MDSKAENTVGHGVVDDIGHLDALVPLTKMMLVVPEPAWSDTLLVHEVVWRGDMRDLSQMSRRTKIMSLNYIIRLFAGQIMTKKICLNL